MIKKYQKPSYIQLDEMLARFEALKNFPPPRKGWIRAIRNALGMSGRQLGERLRVSKMRVADLEKAEAEGTTTLKSLRRAAEALDCVLVYILVPHTSLNATVQKQAKKKAKDLVARASHTMALEDQALSEIEQEKALETATASVVYELPRNLWDKD